MPRRVFIGLTEVAGYFGNLQRGLEELGVETTYLDLSGHPFDYRRPSPLGRWGRTSIRLAARADASPGWQYRFWRTVWLVTFLFQMPVRLALLVRAAMRHDAFIFSSDTFLPRNLDLRFLRLLRKRMVVTFTGTDHRPPYLDGWLNATGRGSDGSELAERTEKVFRRVRTFERYADEIVALPASSHFHTRPIVDFLRVGIPFPALAEAHGPNPFRGEGVRILHSPSNPVGKGSALIRAAIDELRGRGHAIDYFEIVRRPHHEVLAALRHCDFVVDEVYSDTPMAGFATEAAAFGKPAVVTGYYAELIGEQLPAEAIPPSVFDVPDRLVESIERLVVDEAFRRGLGERARAFVLDYWTPTAVARRYLRILDGDVPADWRWNPARQRYLYGWGMTREHVAAAVRGLTGAAGRDALGLSHNSALEARMLEMAGAAIHPGSISQPAASAADTRMSARRSSPSGADDAGRE
jgi:hypothetical protein